jgi:uncharacterized protein YjiS (DUF1127 family)
MSTCIQASMRNHHAHVSYASVLETLRIWRDRYQQRRELAHWAERDAHDAGLSMTDIIAEAQKPFWRA